MTYGISHEIVVAQKPVVEVHVPVIWLDLQADAADSAKSFRNNGLAASKIGGAMAEVEATSRAPSVRTFQAYQPKQWRVARFSGLFIDAPGPTAARVGHRRESRTARLTKSGQEDQLGLHVLGHAGDIPTRPSARCAWNEEQGLEASSSVVSVGRSR
jgi:hypothetical protein